jgi:hypothetical protein
MCNEEIDVPREASRQYLCFDVIHGLDVIIEPERIWGGEV